MCYGRQCGFLSREVVKGEVSAGTRGDDGIECDTVGWAHDSGVLRTVISSG